MDDLDFEDKIKEHEAKQSVTVISVCFIVTVVVAAVTFCSKALGDDFVSIERKLWNDAEETEKAEAAEFLQYALQVVELSHDLAARHIICRLVDTSISVGALSRATGISRKTIMESLRRLINMNLVHVSDIAGSYILMQPASTSALARIRRLAKDLCPEGDGLCD